MAKSQPVRPMTKVLSCGFAAVLIANLLLPALAWAAAPVPAPVIPDASARDELAPLSGVFVHAADTLDDEATPAAAAPSAVLPLAPIISATKTDTYTDVDGSGNASPGDVIRYRVVIANSGSSDATGADLSDTIDASTTLSGTFKSTPIARDDAYAVLGNVSLTVPVGSGLISGLNAASSDQDPDGGAVTATVVTAAATTNGGSITIAADGSFAYDPPPGFEGTDSYLYTITDDEAETDTAIVSFVVSDIVWFVDNSAGGSANLGTYGDPFTSTASLNSAQGAAPTSVNPGDAIFVYQGTGTYVDGVDLQDDQVLLGQGIDLLAQLAALGIVPPAFSDLAASPAFPLRPTIIDATGNGITVGQDNTIRGLDVGATPSGAGIVDDGTSVGTLVVDTVTISGSGGAIDIDAGGTPTIVLDDLVSLNSPGVALRILNTSGGASLTVNNATTNTTISSPGSHAIYLQNNAGGATFDLGSLANITTLGGHGILADNIGTLDIGATTVAINAAGGAALDVSNTALRTNGVPGVTFASLSSTNSSTDGVRLNTIADNVTVSGLTDINTPASNGIEIQDSSGDVTLGTTEIDDSGSDGIYLNNNGGDFTINSVGGGIAFSSDNDNNGIRAVNVADVTISGAGAGSLFQVQGASMGAGVADAHGIHTTNADRVLLDFVHVHDIALPNSNDRGIYFEETTVAVTVTNSVIENIDDGEAIFVDNATASTDLQVTITNNAIAGNGTDHTTGEPDVGIQLTFGQVGSVTAKRVLATIADNTIIGVGRGMGIAVEGNTGTGASGPSRITISNNVVQDLDNDGIDYAMGGTSVSKWTIVDNELDADIPAIAGGAANRGIDLVTNPFNGTADVTIDNNAIIDFPDEGIRINLIADPGNGTIRALIEDNTLASAASDEGIYLDVEVDYTLQAIVRNNTINYGGDSLRALTDETIGGFAGGTLCLDATGNTGSGGIPVGEFDLDEYLGTFTSPQASVAAMSSANNGVTVSASPGVAFGSPACSLPLASFVKLDAPMGDGRPRVNAELAQGQSIAQALVDSAPASRPSEAAAEGAGQAPGILASAPEPLSGETINIPLGTLNSGQVVTITFEVTVDSPLPAGVSQVCNQGLVSGDNFTDVLTDDPAVGGTSDPTCTAVFTELDLRIDKRDGGVTVHPGDILTYTLTFTNVGSIAASGVVITETVPANTTFNAGASTAGWTCAPSINAGSTCTYTVGSLTAGGGNGQIDFAVDVESPLSAGATQISNTAEIGDDGANGPDSTSADNTASETTPVVTALDMRIDKDDGGVTASPGDLVTYTLTYTNTGDRNATGVVLTETVPAHTTFNAGASTAGWACVPDASAGSECTLSVGAVAGGNGGGQVYFAVDVKSPLSAGVSQISNTAEVGDDGANGPDSTPGDNTASDTTPVDAAPDLQITKSDGDVTAQPGDTIGYVLTMTNRGNQNATGVLLTETVPANTTFKAGSSTPGWVCSPDNSAGSTCTFDVSGAIGGEFDGDGNLVVTVSFSVDVSTTLPIGFDQVSNTAEVGDDGTNGADPTPGNNTATEFTPLDAPGKIVLLKVPSPDDGSNFRFDTDLTPSVVAIIGGGDIVAFLLSPRTYRITETVPADWSLTGITFETDDPADTSSRSGATALVDLDANEIITVTFHDLFVRADLEITKSPDSRVVAAGGPITYTLTYTNNGPGTAVSTLITDLVPVTLTNPSWVSSGAPITQTNTGLLTYTWEIADLASGQGGVITITGQLAPGIIDGTVFTNTAEIGHPNTGDDPTNNGDDGAVSVELPALFVTKDADLAIVEPCDVVTFTVTVANVGSGNALNVSITDALPSAGFVYKTGSTLAIWPDGASPYTADPSGSGLAGDPLTWNIRATLEGGEGLVLTYQAMATTDIENTVMYTNRAWAYGEDALGNAIPADSSAVVPADSDPDDGDEVSVAGREGSISGTAWWDADGEGDRDEIPAVGLGGIVISLEDEDGNVRSTTTGPDGTYAFDKLCTGRYTTTIELSSLPGGGALTTAQVRVITLSAGLLDAAGRDAGVRGIGALGDLVWNDTDLDGALDAGEPGMASVGLALSLDGTVVATILSDVDGLYSFAGLFLDLPYTVQVTMPLGYGPTTATSLARTLSLAAPLDNSLDFGFAQNLLDVRHYHDHLCPGWGQRYDITVHNATNMALTNVLVRSHLPPEVRYSDTTTPTGVNTGGTYYPGPHMVVWDLGALPANGMANLHLHVYINSGVPIGTVITLVSSLESAQTGQIFASELFVVACPSGIVTPTATGTPTRTGTPTATGTATSTRTDKPTMTPTLSPTPKMTLTPGPTSTPTRTASSTPTRTPKETPTPPALYLPLLMNNWASGPKP